MTEVLIHLSHWETRRSIPVLLKGVGRWWIHNLTRSCTSSSEWNRRPRMSFFRSPKMWKSHGERYGMYGGCWKCFPAKSLKLIPHHFGSMGTGVIMQKDDFVRQHSRAFWLYGASQHPQPLKKNHASLLFFACFHFQCWTNTLYTTLTSRAIKKQLCGPVRFHYACLLPYIWQYRYITVLPAFARNMFYGGCSVFIWLPLIGLVSVHTVKPWNTIELLIQEKQRL